MIALVYLKTNNKIIIKIEGVTSYTETDIIGESGIVRGIDLSLADFVIVDLTIQEVGHTLINYTDKRSDIPASPEEQIRQLQETVAELQAQLTQP